MKLLFDQNISYRIVKQLKDLFPEAEHLKKLDLINADDKKIWEFAKKNNYTIVTKDADFYEISMIYGYPPKIIWIRTGNTNTQNLLHLFRKNYQSIVNFITSEEFNCFELI